MKILHVYKTYSPETKGGVESFIKELSSGMLNKKVTSDVFCLTKNGKLTIDKIEGVKVYRIPKTFELSSTPFSIKAFLEYKKIVKDYDIIHFHFPYPFQDMLHFFCSRQKKSLVTYHSDIVKQKYLYYLYKPLESFFLKNVDSIVATSENYKHSSLILKKYAHKTGVIPIGISEKSEKQKENRSFLQDVQKKVGDNFFLFLGVLRYYKGINLLIEAAKKNGLSVIIAGAGPFEDDLKSMAKDCKNILFVGEVDEEKKYTLLKNCFAFVFPSHLRSEAFGISLLEASMEAKPMITVENSTGTSFVNKNMETGYVLEKPDAGLLSDAMVELSKNKDNASKMGANARKRYLEYFTLEKMVNSYLELYKKLCNKS